jgi:hypothetical protein
VPLTTIAKTVGWKGAETFAKFYDKTIQKKTVQEAIQTSKK